MALSTPPAVPRYVLCGLPGQKPDVWCWSAVVFAAASERGVETLKPAMCAACPPGRLQRHSSLRRSAADDTNYRPTDLEKLNMIKRGLVYPGVCGAP